MKQSHSCLFNHELLVDYVTRSITPGERVTVEQHLAQCAGCRKEVKDLEETWLALDAWNENKETIQPRLNDFRLRLDAVRRKPTFRERIWNQWEIIMTPMRLIPASPVLAMILTGFFAYVGWQTQWGTAPEGTTIQPSLAAHSVSNNVTVTSSARTILTPSSNELGNGQIGHWNSLVQNSNNPSKSQSNFLIRMATDGLDYVHYTNYPSKDILTNFNPNPYPIRPVSMQTMRGELVRLE